VREAPGVPPRIIPGSERIRQVADQSLRGDAGGGRLVPLAAGGRAALPGGEGKWC
jgi:hypothetical protein